MKKQIRSHSEVISAHSPDYSVRAAAVIRGGGIIAFPTETYYGLGVDPFNKDGLERLFKLKRRSLSKAILLIINNLSQLDRLIISCPKPYQALIDAHWPGPLTLVFPALASLPELLTGGSGTIGIRMSSSEIATTICKSSGTPITATSANISGKPPAACVEEVVGYFGDKIDLIIDGGAATAPQCSTIAAIQGGGIRVVRSGMVKINTE